MNVQELMAGDIDMLKQMDRGETNAKQRDRYRAAALALEGMQTKDIMLKLDRSKNFVQRWSYAYRDGGIEALVAKSQTGRPSKLVLDQAGWHIAKALEVPTNITLLHLPAYSPELNPIERLWAYIKSHYLSNRVYKNYQEIFDVTKDAWNKISQNQFKSICHASWIMHEN